MSETITLPDGAKVWQSAYSLDQGKWLACWADGTQLLGDNDELSYFDSAEEAIECIKMGGEGVVITPAKAYVSEWRGTDEELVDELVVWAISAGVHSRDGWHREKVKGLTELLKVRLERKRRALQDVVRAADCLKKELG